MAVKLRKAQRDDLDQITEMWYKLAKMHEDIVQGYDLSQDARDAWREFVENGLKRKNMCTFVAEDEELVGFLNVVIRERLGIFEDTEIGMILDVFIKKERRGKGIGSDLLNKAENWIKSKGIDAAVITVSPVNEKAVDFWEDKGYETYLLKKRAELS
ncbi:MAG: GNAT family N-acetyltransferase [Candidatus Thermoplasmatota archaeon]